MKKVPLIVLIIIVILIIAVAGVFAYKYFSQKSSTQTTVSLTENQQATATLNVQNQQEEEDNFSINWIKDKDFSEHVGSKKAEFPISKPGLSPYTKVLFWPVIKNILDPQVLTKINKILDFDENLGGPKGQPAFSYFDATEYNGITDVNFVVNYDKNDILSLSFSVATYGAYPDNSYFAKNINIKTGDLVNISDLTSKNKTDILSLLNKKLQAIKDNAGEAKNNEYGNELLQKAKFTEDSLNYFKITNSGIEYNYDFGFPHVIQALQPNGLVFLTWDELK